MIISEPIILIDYLTKKQNISRKKAKMLLTNGLVYVNNEKQTKYNYPLLQGSNVEIKEYNVKAMSKSDIDIIYENKDILVVNKPAGLLTISTLKEKEKTLYHKVSNYIKNKNKNAKIFIIHRLDKETSGIVIFAKNEKTKNIYQKNWDKFVIYRGYIAIVEGRPKKNKDRVINYLTENEKTLKIYSTTKDKGKLSITNYEVVKYNSKYSLLNIEIETGRKNQIRVTMKDMNCPIVGDEKYGSKSCSLKRMALHANKLTIINHSNGNILKLNSDMPDIFKKIIN